MHNIVDATATYRFDAKHFSSLFQQSRCAKNNSTVETPKNSLTHQHRGRSHTAR
jgi:hypothetical protein